VGSDLPPNNGGFDDDQDEATEVVEQVIARCLLKVLSDGSPLVRADLAIGLNLLFKICGIDVHKPGFKDEVLQILYQRTPERTILVSLEKIISLHGQCAISAWLCFLPFQ